MKFNNVLITFFCLFSILFDEQTCGAVLDPLTGTRFSLAITQGLLAAPPLPSLEPAGSELTMQAAYSIAKASDPDHIFWDGEFKGPTLGLGFSSELKRNLGFFGMALFNRMTGDIKILDGFPIVFQNFTANGTAVALGANWRLVGYNKSPFSMGLFAGPAIMSFDTSFVINGVTYGAKPFLYGALGGAQFKIRMGDLFFNPYALYFKEMSSRCKKMTSSAGPLIGPGCEGDPSALPLDATFSAYGLVIGINSLQLNVYSKLQNDPQLDDIIIQTYALSYTFVF